ncbi:TerB family tellurite resistance protein [Acidovorax sp. FG27]|uniref:tellurite resistance TerB family protein n=1 Tax=Acidovorax sp. FG27 TaxID=3133652 RepID=UPI0030E8FEC4
MLKALHDFLDTLGFPNAETQEAERQRSVQLATAVLLVEVMHAEPQADSAQRQAVARALQERFPLQGGPLDALMQQADATARTAYDYQHFTSVLNEHWTQPEKIRLVEALWQVAYADGHAGAEEQHAINKIAGLLYVTHGEYIAGKMYAQEAAAQAR